MHIISTFGKCPCSLILSYRSVIAKIDIAVDFKFVRGIGGKIDLH